MPYLQPHSCDVVDAWSKTLGQIQLAESPLQTQIQIPIGTIEKYELII